MKRLNYAAEQLGPHKISCSTRHSNVLNQFCIWIIRSSFSFSMFAFAATQKEVSLSSGGTKVTSQAMRGPHSSRIGSDRFGQNPKHLLLEIWNLRVILFQGIHQDLAKSHSTWLFYVFKTSSNQKPVYTGQFQFVLLRSKTSKTCGFFMAKSTRAI